MLGNKKTTAIQRLLEDILIHHCKDCINTCTATELQRSLKTTAYRHPAGALGAYGFKVEGSGFNISGYGCGSHLKVPPARHARLSRRHRHIAARSRVVLRINLRLGPTPAFFFFFARWSTVAATCGGGGAFKAGASGGGGGHGIVVGSGACCSVKVSAELGCVEHGVAQAVLLVAGERHAVHDLDEGCGLRHVHAVVALDRHHAVCGWG